MSYISVRRAVGIIGLLLPVALGPVGWLFFGIDWQDNISSYYHTPLRDVFVGSMCAIGIFLFCYQGYDQVENWTANLGCISALGVALFPLDAGSDPLYQSSPAGYVHIVCGGMLFLTLAAYSLFHFPIAPIDGDEEEPHVQQRNFVYRASGFIILLSLIGMGIYLILIPPDWKRFCNEYNVLFWLEWISVWAFAAAWLTKGRVIFADLAIDLLAVIQGESNNSGGAEG